MAPKSKQPDAPQDKSPIGDLPPSGTQKFIFRNGTIYEGEYSTIDGRVCRHGFGKLIENLATADPDDCPGFDPIGPLPGSCRAQVFDGFWEKDVFKKGKISYVDGSEYLGEIDGNGSYVTGGVYTFPCGSKWIGGFLGYEMHGEGHFIDKDGTAWKGVMDHNNCASTIRILDYTYKEPVLFEKSIDGEGTEAETAQPQVQATTADDAKAGTTARRSGSGPKG